MEFGGLDGVKQGSRREKVRPQSVTSHDNERRILENAISNYQTLSWDWGIQMIKDVSEMHPSLSLPFIASRNSGVGQSVTRGSELFHLSCLGSLLKSLSLYLYPFSLEYRLLA